MNKPQLIYHQLDEPFFPSPYGENSGISALHDLYPGRPLTTSDGFNRYEITPEDPEGARRTFLNSKHETQEYARLLNARAIADGGGDDKKVLTHAIDDPSSVIQDPSLKSASMQDPQTINNGQPIIEPPRNINIDEINDLMRGKQMEGTARSEGITSNPYTPGMPGIVERYEPQDGVEIENSVIGSSTFSQLFLALVVLLLIIGIIVLIKKRR